MISNYFHVYNYDADINATATTSYKAQTLERAKGMECLKTIYLEILSRKRWQLFYFKSASYIIYDQFQYSLTCIFNWNLDDPASGKPKRGCKSINVLCFSSWGFRPSNGSNNLGSPIKKCGNDANIGAPVKEFIFSLKFKLLYIITLIHLL